MLLRLFPTQIVVINGDCIPGIYTTVHNSTANPHKKKIERGGGNAEGEGGWGKRGVCCTAAEAEGRGGSRASGREENSRQPGKHEILKHSKKKKKKSAGVKVVCKEFVQNMSLFIQTHKQQGYLPCVKLALFF